MVVAGLAQMATWLEESTMRRDNMIGNDFYALPGSPNAIVVVLK